LLGIKTLTNPLLDLKELIDYYLYIYACRNKWSGYVVLKEFDVTLSYMIKVILIMGRKSAYPEKRPEMNIWHKFITKSYDVYTTPRTIINVTSLAMIITDYEKKI